MKTARERAEIMLDAIELYKGVRRELTIDAIERALEEQDEITRKSVLHDVNKITTFENLEDKMLLSYNKVYNAIMNTKAV